MKLLKISAAGTLLAIHLKKDDNANEIYFADIELSDEFEPVENQINRKSAAIKYNKNSLYSIEKGSNTYKVFYNMYSSKTPLYQSYMYKNGKKNKTGKSTDFQDIVNHRLSAHMTDTVQVDNMIYAIEPMNTSGRLDLSCNIISYLSADNKTTYPSCNIISTCIYDKNKIRELLSAGQELKDIISTALSCVEYNMLYEIDGTIYNDYESMNIAALTFKAKNQYDSSYTMLHDNDSILDYARIYTNINKCDDLIYMKYKDNVKYTNNQEKSSISNPKFGLKLQNIEVINKINRYMSGSEHNTNLYSIAVTTDILDQIKKNSDNEKIDDIIEKIRIEMKNCIRAIVESVQPAHTLLYDVYINGK